MAPSAAASATAAALRLPASCTSVRPAAVNCVASSDSSTTAHSTISSAKPRSPLRSPPRSPLGSWAGTLLVQP